MSTVTVSLPTRHLQEGNLTACLRGGREESETNADRQTKTVTNSTWREKKTHTHTHTHTHTERERASFNVNVRTSGFCSLNRRGNNWQTLLQEVAGILHAPKGQQWLSIPGPLAGYGYTWGLTCSQVSVKNRVVISSC